MLERLLTPLLFPFSPSVFREGWKVPVEEKGRGEYLSFGLGEALWTHILKGG